MPKFFKKYGLLFWLSFILIAGFAFTAIASYLASRDVLRRSLAEQTLPMTGDNVYSEIQKDILRPIFVSAQMANDTFVRDWILNGEDDPEAITKYLKEVKNKVGLGTTITLSS